jgi:hypothetical protein
MRERVRFKMAYGARLFALVAVMLVFKSPQAISEGVPDMTTEQELTDLNVKIAEMEQREQRGGKDAEDFFTEVLSNELVFRRASGTVVGRKEFIDGLKEPYPFKELKAEEIEVRQTDELPSRALVTLIIVGTRDNNTEGRYRNIRLFSEAKDLKYGWRLEFWYNYELTTAEQ